MNKKLITLAVAAAMTAPAAVFAEATIYGVLHNHLDYVDVDQNARAYGPTTKLTVTGVPNVPLRSDNLYITADPTTFLPNGIMTVGGGPNSVYTVPDIGWIVRGGTLPNAVANAFYNPGQVVFPGDVFSNNFNDTPPFPNTRYAALQASESFKGWDINSNDPANRVGIKGSEDLGGGLKAIYQIELGVSLANITGDGDLDNGDRGDGNGVGRSDGINMRNSFVGLAGNFGTFLIGRHDTPLKISTGKLDLFADTLADYNHTLGFQDIRADNTVAYISPSFSGFQFAAATIPAGGSTPLGWGAPGDSPDGIADAWSAALIYSNGPWYASAAYERLGEKHWESTLDAEYQDLNTGVTNTSYRGIPGYGTADDWNKWRFGLGVLDWNGFTLTGIYESHSNVIGAPKDSDMQIWQVQAGYSFGNNTIKGMYGNNDADSCVGAVYSVTCSSAIQAVNQYYGGVAPVADLAYLNQKDHNSWAVAFDHNFSKRTRAYALYTATDSDQKSSDWSGISLGVIHKF